MAVGPGSGEVASPVPTSAADTPFATHLRESWRITYPIIVASLSTLALAVVDTAILGRYSTTALATVGLVLPIHVLASAMIVPWGTAVQILVARWKGAEDHRRVERMLTAGLGLCAVVGAVVSVVMLLAAPQVIRLVTGGDPLPDSAMVLRILALCLPLTAVTAHYRGVFGGLGETAIAMRVALLVNVTNIPLDYALVFGLDLGAIGSAMGTLGATLLGALSIVWFGHRRLSQQYALWDASHLAGARDLVTPLWRIGWPDVTFALVIYGADVLLVAMVAGLGDASLAGYRMMVTTISVLFAVAFGASSGISILVGQRLGADDLGGAGAYRRSGMALMTGLALLIIVPPLTFPTRFFGLFSPDAAAVTAAATAVPTLLGITPAMVAGLTWAGVLRAGGDTRSLLYVGVVSHFVFAVPVAWLCTALLGFGLEGVYIGFLAGWIARAALTYVRYRGGRWAQPETRVA